MEEADCLGAFGIEELLDFSQEDFAGLDDCSKNSDSSGLSSLIDSRTFCVPEMGWFDFKNAKVLRGSSAREEEKNRMRAQQQQQQEQEVLYMTSPVSVLESSATSERSAMVSMSSVHTGDVKNVFSSTGRSKRGRTITPTTRTSYSASSDEEELEDVDEEEEDDDDKDADVELDEEDDEDEDDDEEEEDEDEEEEEEEHSETHESDCALSTESEVVTEEDDGLRPPLAKRQCKEVERPRPNQLVAQHQSYQQQQQQQQQPQRRPQPQQPQQQQQQQQNCLEMPSRKCSHCQTQKTPQWRAGPLGPKTLCNACGVRFKSGRLLPEYRPAGSPTFVLEKHSNSHRKVLEMRRQREVEVVNRLKREAEGELAEEEVLIG